MPRRFGREQLEGVLASDLDEGARVIWVYLAMCSKRGIGEARLRERLDLIDFDGALEVLRDERLVKNVSGKLHALPLVVRVEEEGSDTAGELAPVRLLAEEMLAVYNEHRAEALPDAPPISASDRQFSKLEELAEWLTESGVEFEDFLAFAVKKTDWMRKRSEDPIAFPPLNVVTSPWLRDEFLAAPKRDKAPAHAGKSYGTPDAVRAQLTAAGFRRAGRMTAEELRNVMTWAENMIADPDGFPEPDTRWRDEITFLVRRMKTAKGGVDARRP